MQFVGHHSGSLANAPDFRIDSPPVAMTFFGEHFLKTKPTVELTREQLEEIEIMNLNRRLEDLQKKLKNKSRLLPFARNISKKLRCLGEMSQAEMLSAGKFGIDVKDWQFSKNWSFRRPILKYDEETFMDNNFLRGNGELKEFACASVQFPRALHNGIDIDSTIFLHKGEDDLFSLQSEACDWREFSESSSDLPLSSTASMSRSSSGLEVDSDAFVQDVEHFLSELKRLAKMSEANEERSNNDLELAKDIQRMATEIIQIASKTNANKSASTPKTDEPNLSVSPIPVSHAIKMRDVAKGSGAASRIPVRIKSHKPEAIKNTAATMEQKKTAPTSAPRVNPSAPPKNGRLQNKKALPKRSTNTNSSNPQPTARPTWKPSFRP